MLGWINIVVLTLWTTRSFLWMPCAYIISSHLWFNFGTKVFTRGDSWLQYLILLVCSNFRMRVITRGLDSWLQYLISINLLLYIMNFSFFICQNKTTNLETSVIVMMPYCSWQCQTQWYFAPIACECFFFLLVCCILFEYVCQTGLPTKLSITCLDTSLWPAPSRQGAFPI